MRLGRTFLSIGWERPPELTWEEYNNRLIDSVEDRLEHDDISKDAIDMLYQAFTAAIDVPPSFLFGRVTSYTFTYIPCGTTNVAVHGNKEEIGEDLYQRLLRTTCSHTHTRLMHAFRRGLAPSRCTDAIGGGSRKEEHLGGFEEGLGKECELLDDVWVSLGKVIDSVLQAFAANKH